jgi:hypothetical protein
VLDDGQAEARCRRFARAAGGDAVEAFGEARQVGGGNAVAGVDAPRSSAPPSASRSKRTRMLRPPACSAPHWRPGWRRRCAIPWPTPSRSNRLDRRARSRALPCAQRQRHRGAGWRAGAIATRSSDASCASRRDRVSRSSTIWVMRCDCCAFRAAWRPVRVVLGFEQVEIAVDARSAACAIRARRWPRSRAAPVPGASACSRRVPPAATVPAEYGIRRKLRRSVRVAGAGDVDQRLFCPVASHAPAPAGAAHHAPVARRSRG